MDQAEIVIYAAKAFGSHLALFLFGLAVLLLWPTGRTKGIWE